jgi:hypothetical protein
MRGKRRIQRNPAGAGLVRGADGRLLPAHHADIGDVWAHQKRLRLKDAIEADDKKRARKQRRRSFFGAGRNTATDRRKNERADGVKTVEIKLQVPRISLTEISRAFKKAKLPNLSKRQKIISGGAVALVVVAVAILGLSGGAGRGNVSTSPEAGGVLGTGQGNSEPGYQTLLPTGKSIEDLGGWGRVSPPGKDPVFAYIDNLGGVRINVSQQPLPDNFKKDTFGEIEKLAESFSAKEKVTVGDITAFVGTSAQGPQSVILAKNNLLVLIKSEAKLTDEQWMAYIGSLR